MGTQGRVIAVDLADRLLALGRVTAAARSLGNVEFRLGDMESLEFPDGHFDAVACVFGIFFVPDMPKQVRELWRMVRPGAQLAITTWGPRIFEPVYSRWREKVRKERPDLYTAFHPWDRITEVESVQRLLREGGIADAMVVAEAGMQRLRSPEDWWTVALGSGLRWTIDQMGPATSARVRDATLAWLQEHGVTELETNVIYALATKAAAAR